MDKEKIHVQKRAQRQGRIPNPASLSQTDPPCGAQLPSPGPQHPAEEQESHLPDKAGGCFGLSPKDSVSSADHFQEADTFGLHVLGSTVQI